MKNLVVDDIFVFDDGEHRVVEVWQSKYHSDIRTLKCKNTSSGKIVILPQHVFFQLINDFNNK